MLGCRDDSRGLALVWLRWLWAGSAHGRMSCSAGWALGTQLCLRGSLTRVFLKVLPTLITGFISQTPAGLRPRSHSSAPTMGKEGKMLSPTQLLEAARWQDRILSPLHHPLGTGRALGSTATIPRKQERNVRNEA